MLLLAGWLFAKKRWRSLAALLAAILLAKLAGHFGRPARFWRKLLNDPALDTPRLYIYSQDDHLTDHAKLQELIEHRRAKGQQGLEALCFDNSEHCGHLRRHPKEYKSAVLRFVAAGNLTELKHDS